MESTKEWRMWHSIFIFNNFVVNTIRIQCIFQSIMKIVKFKCKKFIQLIQTYYVSVDSLTMIRLIYLTNNALIHQL